MFFNNFYNPHARFRGIVEKSDENEMIIANEDQKKDLQNIAKGAGFLFAGTLMVYVLKFFYRLLVSRYLGPSDYGLLSLGEAIANVAIIFTTLGLSFGIIKLIPHYLSRDDPARVRGMILAILKISGLMSIFVAIVTILFSQYIAIGIFHKPLFVPIIIITAITIPFFTVTNSISNIFLAFQRVNYQNLINVAGRGFILLLLTVVAIAYDGKLFWIAVAYLFSHISSLIIGLYFLIRKKIFMISSEIKPKYEYYQLISFSFPIFLSGIFVQIMGWVDTLFLSALKEASEVGIYNAALPLVSTLSIFVSVVGNIFLPTASSLYAKNKTEKVAGLYATVSRWTFLSGLPIMLFMIFFSKQILTILFGAEYRTGHIALQILIGAYFLRLSFGPSSQALMMFNETKKIFYINSFAAVVNVILNYLLIPPYSMMGAAIATTGSIIIQEGLIFWIAKKKLGFVFSLKMYARYLLSGLIGISIIYWMSTHMSTNALTISVLALTYSTMYFIMLIMLGGFREEDLVIIQAIEKKFHINLNILTMLIKRFL